MNEPKDRKWLEDKIEGFDPEVKHMIRQVWECDTLDDVKRLVFRWDKEGLFAKIDKR